MATTRTGAPTRFRRHARQTAIGALVLSMVLAACADTDPESTDDTADTSTDSADADQNDDGGDANEGESSDGAQEQAGSEADAQERGSWEPGLHDFSLTVDDVERTGAVLLPEQWTADADLPLVVTLHGSQYDGFDQIEWSEVAPNAEAEGYVVLAPDGSFEGEEGGWMWNVPGVTDAPEGTPDDISFLRELVEWSTDELGTSQDDVFAAGYSGGGRLISQAACDDPELFAAIAPVTGLRAGVPVEGQDGTWVPDPQTCDPDTVTPIITFVGTDDPVNPLDGGGADYWLYGHEAALERWAQIGGHTDRDETEVEDGVVVTTIGDRDIVSWSVEDAGHVWPGSSVFENETDWAGEPTYAIDATELIWEFFDEHRP